MTFGMLALAEMLPLVVAQFKANDDPGVTTGAVRFAVTFTVAVLVHPLEVLVTVTVYDPL